MRDVLGLLFSPDDIEHGLIRSNRPHPSTPQRTTYFNVLDPRSRLSVPYFDPRIHFILNCGARSCPPIQVLTGDPNEALRLAAAAYMQSEIRFENGNDIFIFLLIASCQYSRATGIVVMNVMISNMFRCFVSAQTIVLVCTRFWTRFDESNSNIIQLFIF